MKEEDRPGLDLRIALCEIDNGRFEDIVHALKITDACTKCAYWDKTLSMDHAYRCHVSGTCIDATLNPRLINYMQRKIGMIDE